MRVLFVCLGNICRSPMAETVFRDKVNTAGLQDDIVIDSAGTAAYHIGEQADERMRQHARNRGYHITSIARQVQKKDFELFDHIIAMDDSNLAHLRAICPVEYLNKLHKMTDFSPYANYSSVPDPYYGAAEGFELVIDLLEEASQALLKYLNTP